MNRGGLIAQIACGDEVQIALRRQIVGGLKTQFQIPSSRQQVIPPQLPIVMLSDFEIILILREWVVRTVLFVAGLDAHHSLALGKLCEVAKLERKEL